MSTARAVHVVVPAGIDDPLLPSGGNTYDRRLCDGLTASGWSVRTREVTGDWPCADAAARTALAGALTAAPDAAAVVVDGLVASACPEELVPASRRRPTVVLVHLPVGVTGDRLDRARESAVLDAAAAVVATSDWTRRWLLETYRLDPDRVHVAQPGVDPARPATGSADGGHLLCVGALTPGKGQHTLVAALARLADRPWHCACVGTPDRAPDFAATLRREIRDAGLADRVILAGALTGTELASAYAAADLLVHPSSCETYGMVVTEALARGLPVLGCDVGGVPEALGVTADGCRPGLLVPPGDAAALATALRRWLDDAVLRRELRAAAARRSGGLRGWAETADRVARVLEEVAG